MAKKILIGIAGFLILVIVILAAIPFFYDVNTKLRPIIIEQIEANMDAKAELGKLSLNLLWGVNIGIESLKITENQNKNVLFELKDSKLRIPYLSLLTGKISVTLISENPGISLIRYPDGSLNVTKVLKTKETPATGTTAGTTSPTEPTSADSTNPGSGTAFAASRLAFSTNITDAVVKFKDLQGGIEYKIEKLNVKLDNVGVNREFDFLVSTALDINNKKDMKLNGTLSLSGDATLGFGGTGLESFKTVSELDLSKIEIHYGNVLNKSKDVSLKVKTDLLAEQLSEKGSEVVKLNKIEVEADSLKLLMTGVVKNLNQPTLDLKVSSSDLKLKDWKEIILPIKQYDMSGTVVLDLAIQGTTEKPNLNGKFELKDADLKLPALVQRISDLNVSAQFSGERMTFQKAALRIGESDLKMSGYLENFTAPKIDLEVTSNLLDLDKMMPKEKEKKALNIQIIETAYAEEKNNDAELRASIASLQANPTLQKMDLTASFLVKKMIVKNATISDVKGDLYFKNLVLTLKNTALKAFEGLAKVFLQMDLGQKAPTYQFTADMTNVNINSAVVSQFKDMDQFITGKVNGNLIVNGSGVEQAQIKNNIKGSGNFFIKEGAWSGAKPLKMIGEKVASIPKAGDALSGVKVSDKFKEFKVDFLIQSGALNIQKALMDMEGAKTAMEATGKIDFDQKLNMSGNILAPIKDVPNDLKAKDGRGKIPFELAGTVSAPEVKWEKMLGTVAKAYAKDEGKKLIQKEAEKLIKDDNVKKLFKNFKF